VKPIKPDSDKVSRANAVVPLVEAGRVVLPAGAGWLTDFIDELSSFPRAPHDDQVDALSMALRYCADFGGDVGFRGMKKLDEAKAAVASGVPIDDAAKAAGVAPSRLEGWIDRTNAGGRVSRLSAMTMRPPRDQLDYWEYACKRVDAGLTVEEACAETLATYNVDIPVEGLRAFRARMNQPLGPSRPRYAPPGATNPFT